VGYTFGLLFLCCGTTLSEIFEVPIFLFLPIENSSVSDAFRTYIGTLENPKWHIFSFVARQFLLRSNLPGVDCPLISEGVLHFAVAVPAEDDINTISAENRPRAVFDRYDILDSADLRSSLRTVRFASGCGSVARAQRNEQLTGQP